MLGWIRHGMSRRAIAERLGISENAVKYHVANISAKLGVAGMARLRRWPGYPAGSAIATGRPSMSTDVHLGPLGQVSLLSRDIEATERFYRDVLALPHVFTFGDLAFFDAAGVRLFLRRVPDEEWRPSSILYFRVDDIDGQFRALEAHHVRTAGEPHVIYRDEAAGTEEWMAFFEDPDGNTLALMSRVPIVPAT